MIGIALVLTHCTLGVVVTMALTTQASQPTQRRINSSARNVIAAERNHQPKHTPSEASVEEGVQ